MNKINKLLFVSLSLIFFASCGTKSLTAKRTKMIIGKWSIHDISMESEKSKTMTAEMKKTIKKMLEGSYMEFKADKSFSTKIAKNENTGTWYISEDGAKLFINTGKKSEPLNIKTLTKENLVLFATNDSGTITMILKKKK